VIRSFKDAEAEKLFNSEFSKKRQAIERPTRKRLESLHGAESLEDLRAIPGNHQEALSGDRKGQHSIRIKDLYRLWVVWTDNGAKDAEIVDYQ
jgi:proteic killer suppression protein